MLYFSHRETYSHHKGSFAGHTHPNAWVFASGSTAARTRLYQMGIARYYEEIKDDLEIYGQFEDQWHPFEKHRVYLAFLTRLKTS